MADKPCGCFSSTNDPNNPTTPPEGTVYVAGSVNCPSRKPCHTPVCDERFRSLPSLRRIEIVGVDGKCLYRLEHGSSGILMVDPKGGVVASESPLLDLPQLVSYVDGANGLLLGRDRLPIESDPPEFPYLVIQLETGEWKKVRGRPGAIGLLVWDQDGYHIRDVDDVNIAVRTPDETTESISLVGFDPSICPAEGEVAQLVKLSSLDSGILWFDAVEQKASVRNLCDLFSQIEGTMAVPFLLACSDQGPVKFSGSTTGGLLSWDQEISQFRLIEADVDKCLDAACCGCSSELFLAYNCSTGKFAITEPTTHVLLWRANTDNGSNVSVDFTLPWPALVEIKALRRFIPLIDSLQVHRADIIVDGIAATGPSDGGLVGYLNSGGTTEGTAVLALPMGGHTAYIGNAATTGGATPQFTGAWLKVVAHKIAECNPIRPPVGAGVVTPIGGSSPGPGPDPSEADRAVIVIVGLQGTGIGSYSATISVNTLTIFNGSVGPLTGMWYYNLLQHPDANSFSTIQYPNNPPSPYPAGGGTEDVRTAATILQPGTNTVKIVRDWTGSSMSQGFIYVKFLSCDVIDGVLHVRREWEVDPIYSADLEVEVPVNVLYTDLHTS